MGIWDNTKKVKEGKKEEQCCILRIRRGSGLKKYQNPVAALSFHFKKDFSTGELFPTLKQISTTKLYTHLKGM